MRTALVTGASRGLGHAIAAALLADGDDVTLAVRDPAACPQPPDRGVVVALDYTDDASIAAAARAFADRHDRLDLLVNCAGVNKVAGRPAAHSKGPVGEVDSAAIEAMFRTNVVGPLVTCREFLPLLASGATVVNVSTSRASLGLVDGPGSLGYAITKAALNMLTRKVAEEVGPRGVTVVAIDPGWVRTDMGGAAAPTSAQTAAAELLATVRRLTPAANGSFMDRSGVRIPW